MKNLLMSLLFISIYAMTFSQPTTELDKKNGYKKFKLGTNLSVYKSQLKLHELSENSNSDQKLYQYIGDDYKDFLGYPLDEIILGFYKNLLANIILDIPATDFDLYDRLLSDLELAFGKSETPDGENSEYTRYNIWGNSKNVIMVLYQYSSTSYTESTRGKIGVSIRVKDIDKIIVLDDF